MTDHTCLMPGCDAELPAGEGVYRAARRLGWARMYCSPVWGTGWFCPDHGASNEERRDEAIRRGAWQRGAA